jgi:quercetin 2,3-dioxygenase
MQTKSVEKVIAPPAPHMVGDGFRMHNFFPGDNGEMTRMSPFFVVDYGAKVDYPPRDTPRGVGVHPHRGFETVTIAYHGRVAHHDSAGNSGVIGEGDVQWMTAASGILHKEYHDLEYSKKGGPFQMVQLWVNLPAAHKMSTPKYQPITRQQMAEYILPDGKGFVHVIAGNYKGAKGPAFTFTPIEMYNAHLKKGASIDFNLPSNYNTGVLVIEGNTTVNNSQTAAVDHFVLFKNDGGLINFTAHEDSILLVLSGEPILEPIMAYGPFLMNNKQEILQAYDDFNAGKFGYLED